MSTMFTGIYSNEIVCHLKMTYFKNKQVSVAEATYRLVRGLDLKRSNIACVFVATGYPRNRSSFFVSTKAFESVQKDLWFFAPLPIKTKIMI